MCLCCGPGGAGRVLASLQVGALSAGPPLIPARRGRSQFSPSLLSGGTRTRALPALLALLPTRCNSVRPGLVKVGWLAGLGLFSAALTRRVVPGGGWCRPAGLVGLMGVGLAGRDDAQKVLAPDRPHCLALMSDDLWSSAVEGWRHGGAGEEGRAGEVWALGLSGGLPPELGAGVSFCRSLEEGVRSRGF